MEIQTILSELKKEGWFFDEEFIRNNEDMLQAIADKTLAMQLQQTGVSGSLSLETIVNYVTKKDLSVHKKVCNLWLKSGNKAGDFPKLPPCWFDVEITLKNGKKYKSMLASINNWGGVQFVINQTFKKRIYLDTDEVVSWEFV